MKITVDAPVVPAFPPRTINLTIESPEELAALSAYAEQFSTIASDAVTFATGRTEGVMGYTLPDREVLIGINKKLGLALADAYPANVSPRITANIATYRRER